MSGRERGLAVASAFLILAWATRAFLLKPMAGWRQSKENEVIRLAARVARGQRLLIQADVLKKSAPAPGAVIGTASGLMGEVNRLARRAGVRVKDLRPEESPRGTRVAVTTEGTWETIARFGYDLTRAPQGLTLEKAAVQRTEGGGNLKGQFVLEKDFLSPS